METHFDVLKGGLTKNPELIKEFQMAFAAIASKHHPSDRAERFVFGGACEWLLAVTAWKAGVKAIPAGHGQNGFDLVQFKEAMQGLWSLKSSAAPKANGDINLRNNISSTTKATIAVYSHPTVFLGPYLPGLTYVDFSTEKALASKIVYDKDAAKIKAKEILDFATANPSKVIPVTLTAVKTASTIDSNLKLVANVLTSGTYPLLGTTIDFLQKYSDKVTHLREFHAKGMISEEEFKKSLQELLAE